MGERLAIISDIHANLPALDAVLEDARRQGVERLACLGDVVGYGADPAACVEAVRSVCAFTLRGNHDHGLFEDTDRFSPPARRALEWTRRNLPPAGSSWLRRLPSRREEGDTLHVHGSPRDPIHEYLYETEARTAAREGPGGPTARKLAECFREVRRVCFVGHTHRPGVLTEGLAWHSPRPPGDRFRLGLQRAIINVGSVGQPRDRDRRASYVIFDGREVLFRRVPYAWQSAMDRILSNPALDRWLALRLEQGV
ncbi:MAG: metallophosphoesterase family protein [Planctomycetes bacterium]|nr:metallophosphoesterase family protein [Planctomycetota bacterium]